MPEAFFMTSIVHRVKEKVLFTLLAFSHIIFAVPEGVNA